jgi:pyruvate dehydrogenase E1 component
VNPAAHIYDPAFAYEIGVIMQDAVAKTMGPEPEDRFWYLTLYNENYPMPPLPEGAAGDAVRAGVLRGMYRFAEPAEVGASGGSGETRNGSTRHATLLFSGPMWQAAMEARDILAADWGVSADAWSVTSYTELREDALSVERANRLHPHTERSVPFVTAALEDGAGPVVAVTDYLRAVPDQVARWMPRPFTSLGTDGFGRSDTRAALRRFFEVDAAHLVVAVLSALAETGDAKHDEVAEAIARYEIDPDSADPWSD